MKKIFRFLAASAVIAASVTTITSCSSEEPLTPGTGPDLASGKEKATLTVTFSGTASTRAVTDANANDNETAISKATIFVFNAQNAYEVDTTVLTPPSAGANKYEVTFYVPTGNNKKVYVGLNLDNQMINNIKLNGLGDMSYPLASQEGLFYISGNTTDPNFKGNPMFNDKPVVVDILPSTVNAANVSVERMTSKVTVNTEGNLDQPGLKKASNANFDPSTLEFAIGNKNNKILPMKEQSTSWIDPNWTSLSVADYAIDFQHEFAVKDKTYGLDWDVSKFVAVDASTVKVEDRNTKYAFENTHKDARYGETTYATIKVKFTPEAYATSFDPILNKPVVTTQTPANTDTLHVVVDNNSYYYYTDRLEAQAHVAYLNHSMQTATNDYTTYYGGYCFYNVFLNADPTTKEYQTYRNNYYQVSIAEIKKLGRPYPEIEDSNKNNIIGATGALTVNITVNPWSLISMGNIILGD
ncbi:MAG: Mfa1 family fimbria major subunit [Tannerellaceae bacterium]|jgi:hypothetical protein|nr:Mfa1 family fimbria major subunit [Tannerellaceae bacterium]